MVSFLVVCISEGAVDRTPKQAAIMKMLPGAETLPVDIFGESEPERVTALYDCSPVSPELED